MQSPLNNNPNDKDDRTRLIAAIIVSLLILVGFNYFVDRPKMEEARRKAEIAATQKVAEPEVKVPENKVLPRTDVLKEVTRIKITGTKVAGSLSLKGARLDDLTLNEHFKTIERKENVELLTPSGADHAFYAESGWIADREVALPAGDTVWSIAPNSASEIVSGGKPVILTWDNGQGLTFEKTVTLDENYLFSVSDRITNNTSGELKMNAYQLVSRHGVPKDFTGFFVLHEGPVAYLGGKLEEPDYDDLIEGEKVEKQAVSGWLGITDKYWMVTMLPEPDAVFDARVIGSGNPDLKHDKVDQSFQADIVHAGKMLPVGQSMEKKSYVYAGVKKTAVMDGYQKKYGFKHLDLAIDFGIWHYLTRPFYFILHFLSSATGNIAIAILLMTVLVRACVFPLASKSFRSMAKMKVIAPQMKELQKKYADDKQKLQMEIYDLYKREDVNPMSGCWPMLIQIPIFFALYKVILISVDLRHAPFWGWIHDLSAPDPTSLFNLFGLIQWDPPQLLMIGAWPCLYCITMVLQMRLSPPAPDPTQQMVHDMMPYMFSILLAQFASGLVIYWTWSNVLGILQQYYILRTTGDKDVSLLRGHSERRKKKKKDPK